MAIRANCVASDYIFPPWSGVESDNWVKKIMNVTRMGRSGEVKESLDVVHFLQSDAIRFVT